VFQTNRKNCNNSPANIQLQPSKPILLTSELNISSELYSSLDNQWISVNQSYYVLMSGVSGLNAYPWPALSCNQTYCKKKGIIFYLSTIEFYVNNTSPDDYTCGPGLIPNESSKSVSIFSKYLSSIKIGKENRYGKPVCPFVFKNAQLNTGMALTSQVDSFLFVSLLRFQESNDIKTSSINSSIPNLLIQNGYNYKLDTGLIHPMVFEKITLVKLTGTIMSIQAELFKHFKLLNYFIFNLYSLGNFFHQIGIGWMNYLNNNSTVFFMTFDPLCFYYYPNKDLCIFAEFPFNRTIYLELDVSENTSLSYMWLCKHGNISSDFCPIETFNWTMLDLMVKLCRVNEKNNSQGSNNYTLYTEYYSTKIIGSLFFELVPFVFIPCACIVGILLNWKIIETLQKNKKKELKENFYKYMSANAKFNCLYCIICVFYPMTSCQWRLSSTFCSSIFTSLFVQYYKIIMMAYFGEVFKMCGNIFYIMMTMNRYLLVGKDHSPWLVTVAQLKLKWVICGSLVFSALINIGHGWEFKAVEDTQQTEMFDSAVSMSNSVGDGYTFSDYPQANHETPYFVYSIVYFCINFGVFFIVNTGLEIKIVRRMQKELTKKRERLANLKAKTSVSLVTEDANLSDKINEEKRREEEDRKKELSVIRMVIINGVLNFILKAPDMLFWMENTQVFNIFHDARIAPGIFGLIGDIGCLTYILSFSSNFLIFYNFNKNFKNAVVIGWNSNLNNKP
jgi:hypothetical protein